MQKPISKVLMYQDARVQIWVERSGFTVVFPDATTEQKRMTYEEDLFALPMNGLVKLAAEYLEELKPRLPSLRPQFGPDIGEDGELYGRYP